MFDSYPLRSAGLFNSTSWTLRGNIITTCITSGSTTWLHASLVILPTSTTIVTITIYINNNIWCADISDFQDMAQLKISSLFKKSTKHYPYFTKYTYVRILFCFVHL